MNLYEYSKEHLFLQPLHTITHCPIGARDPVNVANPEVSHACTDNWFQVRGNVQHIVGNLTNKQLRDLYNGDIDSVILYVPYESYYRVRHDIMTRLLNFVYDSSVCARLLFVNMPTDPTYKGYQDDVANYVEHIHLNLTHQAIHAKGLATMIKELSFKRFQSAIGDL